MAVVFAGPSLPPPQRPSVPGLHYAPPVRQGELYRAALSAPALIGVVDGYFEIVPTVWHKEILWAMAHGIHVYGAGSIGALRAAELADFGMKGVGEVYRRFRAGALADDDEVAVLHGPEEVGYIQVTEAMVNVRATIERAVREAVLEAPIGTALTRIAKCLFYKERTYEAIVAAAAAERIPEEALRRFAAWVPGGKVDQKRSDALEMIAAMADQLSRGVAPLAPSFAFAHTFAWEEALRRAEAAVPLPS